MLREGQPAPDFRLPDQSSRPHSLKDYRGRWIVLYFYPRDNTPGCTIEALDFTRLLPEFQKGGAIILGVSTDSCASHQKFVEKKKLAITLLSDEDTGVQKLYGVWRPKTFLGKSFLGTVRSTFLIRPDGTIARFWDGVSAKGHAEEVLAALKNIKRIK